MRQEFIASQIKEAEAAGTTKATLAELMLQYNDVCARMDEIRQWQKADEASPKYGTQVRVNGAWRPKLPEAGSIEKALAAMNSPDGGLGHSAAAVRAAREFRAGKDAQTTVRSLDGRSPIVPEAERKPFNTTL
jgi:hypothetical protein